VNNYHKAYNDITFVISKLVIQITVTHKADVKHVNVHGQLCSPIATVNFSFKR